MTDPGRTSNPSVNNGWVRWTEGYQPVETIGKTVEVRYRSGKTWLGDAGRVKWRKFDALIDVAYYRLARADEFVDAADPADPSTLGNWIDWAGGPCPVPPNTKVEYRLRNGVLSSRLAGDLDWHWGTGTEAADDIVAYWPVDPQADIPLDPTGKPYFNLDTGGWVSDKPLDIQVGGDHYRTLAIQPVEYIHRNNIGYFEGNVIKYVTRWRAKNGITDLEKAKHYIDLLIQLESTSK